MVDEEDVRNAGEHGEADQEHLQLEVAVAEEHQKQADEQARRAQHFAVRAHCRGHHIFKPPNFRTVICNEQNSSIFCLKLNLNEKTIGSLRFYQ